MEEDSPNQKQPGLDLKEIRQIVEMMSKNDLSYLNIELGSFKLELRRGSDVEAAKDLLSKLSASLVAPPSPSAPVPAAARGTTVNPDPSPTPPPVEAHGPTINSPMVGTFYRAGGVGERPYVNVGDTVDENTVVCIVEAMKVMNEIKAEIRGTVARVLVEDAKPVQYGQPLFELK